MKRTLLTLGIALLSNMAFASKDGGNGGAYLCLERNNCVTYAEAGFRVADTRPEETIDLDTLAGLENIRKLLPAWLNFTSRDVVGKSNEIVIVDTIDQRLSQTFLKKYRDIILKNDPTFDVDKLVIAGFTNENETVIVKSLFEQASAESRSLILIHEYLLRRGVQLIDVLRLDGYLVDYLKANREGTLAKFDHVGFYYAATKASVMNPLYAAQLTLARLLQKKNFLRFEDISAKPMMYDQSNNYVVQIDYYDMIKLKKYDSRLTEIFVYYTKKLGFNETLLIPLSPHITSRDSVLSQLIAEYKASTPDLLKNLKSDDFIKFVKTKHSTSLLEAMQECRGKDDSSIVLYSSESKSGEISSGVLYCSFSNGSFESDHSGRHNWYSFNNGFLSNVMGANLAFSASDLKCLPLMDSRNRQQISKGTADAGVRSGCLVKRD